MLIVSVVGISGCTSSDSSSINVLQPIPASQTDSYKASAQTIPLANMLKNPDTYKGQKIKVTGEIFQIQESSGSTFILLNTPETTSYSDRVAVTYGGSVSFVKGDTITAYGEGGGAYSYKSQEGYDITIPLIKAVLIEGG